MGLWLLCGVCVVGCVWWGVCEGRGGAVAGGSDAGPKAKYMVVRYQDRYTDWCVEWYIGYM